MAQYRITKYNPQNRVDGIYAVDEWTEYCDIGHSFGGEVFTEQEYLVVEKQYIKSILEILKKAKIDCMYVYGLENDLGKTLWQNHQKVAFKKIPGILRDCLRNDCWCRLVNGETFVQFGNDYYMYVGVELPYEIVNSISSKNGLFCEIIEAPPCEPEKLELESLCCSILENKTVRNQIYDHIKSAPDLLIENYCGTVSEELLLKVILESHKDEKLQAILIALVDCLVGSVITDRVFEELIKSPPNIRNSLVVNMCRMNLTEKQLLILCNIGTEYESFLELAFLYYGSDEYPVERLKNLLDRFKRSTFSNKYKELLDNLLHCPSWFVVNDKKTELVKNERKYCK